GDGHGYQVLAFSPDELAVGDVLAQVLPNLAADDVAKAGMILVDFETHFTLNRSLAAARRKKARRARPQYLPDLVSAKRRATSQCMALYALGKLVLWAAAGMAALGLVLIAAGKGYFPHLPGDLSFRLGNARVFFPLATSLLLSVVLTVVLNLLFRR